MLKHPLGAGYRPLRKVVIFLCTHPYYPLLSPTPAYLRVLNPYVFCSPSHVPPLGTANKGRSASMGRCIEGNHSTIFLGWLKRESLTPIFISPPPSYFKYMYVNLNKNYELAMQILALRQVPQHPYPTIRSAPLRPHHKYSGAVIVCIIQCI